MKKALKIAVSVISWIILILALIVTILTFTADRSGGVPSLFGFIPMTVESDSMAPTFSQNDLIIVREIDDVNALHKDDVITFWTIIDGKKVKNTHRIIEVKNVYGNVSFVTKGDNVDVRDSLEVYPVDIIGKWTGFRLGGFGSVMNFLRTQVGFCICVIIPLVLFFLFELYKLIVVIVEIKRPAAKEIDEEEIKKRAIEEYIAEQKKLAEANANSADGKSDKTAENAADSEEAGKPDDKKDD